MKTSLPLIALFALIACGEERPKLENRRGGSEDLSKHQAALVNTLQDLPSCDQSLANTLVFVKELSGFKVCRNKAWYDVDRDKNKGLEDSVVEIQQIKGTEFNLCPSDKGGSCFVEGGEFVRYADGRVKYSIRLASKKATPVANSYQTMETFDFSIASLMHDKAWATSDVVLLKDVRVQFELKDLKFTVYRDLDKDSQMTSADEVLEELELTTF